ncbi:peptidoglycan endopeptidase [Flavobacterium sandaracinum]|uniref:Peptidoglycan endopeptidase n=1 Tax=Flavobacterium sandaracinum TaxID=2541733 RepID=A0A4R5CZ52_9FLAO|nr:peptidoglycan endopeptidase [Flavobacterium sandaracinum]TDE04810.1 peptidoglycan endopeptidase [Flavobacterium sandaracinum]
MTFRVVVTLVFLNSIVLFSQEKITKHTIVKGETISSIAEKYEVKQSAIFNLNPNAKNLLKLNSVLLIPITSTKNTAPKTKIAINNSFKEHEVQTKETLYGIAKQYGISVKELNQVNPTLASSELKIGQKINIPGNATASEIAMIAPTKQMVSKNGVATLTQSNESKSTKVDTFSWEVLPKETKYSITRKYGITIKEFDKANPEIGVKALRVGQKINIPAAPLTETVLASQESKDLPVVASKNGTSVQTIIPKLEEAVILQTNTHLSNTTTSNGSQNETTSTNTPQQVIREVLPKETKYAIAKEYGITVNELEKQNPEVKNGLPVGYKLNILANTVPAENAIANTDAGNNSDVQTTKIDFNNAAKPTFSHDFLDQLIERASENIGSRYRTGGTTKSGFDCSGLMCTTFGAFDINLPRTSREQSSIGTKINTDEAQKGDLIFFKTNGRSQINHVGMVVEVCEDEIKFIHSSVSNGVIISSTKEKYYRKNFSQINRVLQ